MQDGLFFRILRRVNLVMFTFAWIALLAVGGLVVWKEGLPKKIWEKNTEYGVATGPATVTYSLMPQAFTSTAYQPATTPSLYVYSRTNIPSDAPWLAYGPYGAGQVLNLLVVDDKGEGHWLFKSNKQEIVQRDAVFKGTLGAPIPQGLTDVRPVIGIIMVVNEGEPKPVAASLPGAVPLPATPAAVPTAIYMWKLGAVEAVKLLDIDELVNGEQIGADRYHVVYKKGKETRVAVYSLPAFEKLSDKPMPSAPK